MRDDLKAIVEHFFKESTCKSKTGSDQNEQHLVLILDKNVQHLPFESLPILKGRPVSRLPNIAMVQQCLSRSREIQIDSHRSVFYLLNPSGDLTKTEKKLSEPLSR
jgi:separase